MKTKRIIFGISVFMLTLTGILGQQETLYTQFIMNPFYVNPAMAGARGNISVNLCAREQWLGYQLSPKTHIISFEGRLLKHNLQIKSNMLGMKKLNPRKTKSNIGIGGYIFNDRNGLISRTGAQFTYAYHVFLSNRDQQLSFGVSSLIYQLSLNQERILANDMTDPYILNAKPTYIPDVHVGVNYMSRYFFTGISVSKMLQSLMKFGEEQLSSYKEYRHYYLIAGTRMKIGRSLMYEPSILVKSPRLLESLTSDSVTYNLQTDLSFKLIKRNDVRMDQYWGGFNFRTNGDVVFFFGLVLESIQIGYGFDYPIGYVMRKDNFGTHEININYSFGGNDIRRQKWWDRY